MRNFDCELDPPMTAAPKRVAVVEAIVPVVTDTVVVRPSQARGHVIRTEDRWEWSDLRDYVVAAIEQRHGPFPRDPKRESGIFKGFLSRWGDRAPAVARYAFEVCGGYWRGAPVSVNRFCRNSDPYFAEVIVERLDQEKVPW